MNQQVVEHIEKAITLLEKDRGPEKAFPMTVELLKVAEALRKEASPLKRAVEISKRQRARAAVQE